MIEIIWLIILSSGLVFMFVGNFYLHKQSDNQKISIHILDAIAKIRGAQLIEMRAAILEFKNADNKPIKKTITELYLEEKALVERELSIAIRNKSLSEIKIMVDAIYPDLPQEKKPAE